MAWLKIGTFTRNVCLGLSPRSPSERHRNRRGVFDTPATQTRRGYEVRRGPSEGRAHDAVIVPPAPAQ